jgi:hypothetical protein
MGKVKKVNISNHIEDVTCTSEIKRMRNIFSSVIILILILSAMISTSIYFSYTKCLNEKITPDVASGKGNLKFSLSLYPERINAYDQNTSLVFVFRLENIGDNNVRVLPPKSHYTISITVENSLGISVSIGSGDHLMTNIANNDTIILTRYASLFRNASIIESYKPWSLTGTGILHNPDNYTIYATYTTYFFDEDNYGKQFNKVTLDYWHGNLTSNSVVLQAY